MKTKKEITEEIDFEFSPTHEQIKMMKYEYETTHWEILFIE